MKDADLPRTNRGLFRWSVFALAWALLLLFAGANVTTTRSGDAVPSWPAPYLPHDFSKAALIEWSHRGIAAWMGIFTLALAVWTQLRETRATVKRLAWSLVVLVAVQVALGGLRVRFVTDGIDATPTWLKATHAVTGQIYFCTLVALSTVLAPWWTRATRPRELDPAAMSVMRMSILGALLLFAQTLLGALARHGVLPREVHAFFALPALVVVARLVLVGAWDVPADCHEIRRPANLLGVLAATQLALGLVTYFIAAGGARPEDRETTQVVLMNLHLAVGAAMLGTTLSILMRAVHVFGPPTDERVAEAERASAGSAS
jgi:heme A synthase